MWHKCLIVMLVMLMLPACTENKKAREVPSPPATTTSVEPGHIGSLHTPAGDIVPVATSAEALQRLIELSVAHDLTGIDQMRAAGLVVAVPAGTKCQVIRRAGIFTCEVRLLNAGGNPLPITHFVSRDWIK